MMILRRLVSMVALLALAACGGGGSDSGSAPFPAPPGGGGSGGATAADVVLVLSSPTIASNGSQTVTATATAIDTNRNAVSGVRITISADTGVVTPSGTTTGADGKLTALIGIGSDSNVRKITVTAVSGAVTTSAPLNVVTSAPPVPAAADISLALSAASIANNGSATVTATVIAVDANRNTISGIPVTLRVDNDAAIQVSGTTTDAAGTVRGTVNIGSNRANRTIQVTAISGSLPEKVAVLQVTGTRITSTALPAVLVPGTPGKVQYKVTDAANSPLSSFDITIAGPSGVQTRAKTDINGNFEFAYTAPAASGSLDIRASSGGIENITTVIVQSGTGSIPPVPVGTVRSASVRANPSVVGVNASGVTESRSEVRALFIGNDNRPIKDIRVRFDLAGDVNSIGGTFSSGTTVIYSDVNGVAQSAYIPGTRFSPTDGVTVRACWDYADFPANTCPNSGTTSTLTVISDPLSVTIGTDNLIVVDTDLVYTQRFVVQVNDSSGLAKADVQVSPLLDLTAYNQGSWQRPPNAAAWAQVITTPAKCENEDVNRNGVLEVYAGDSAEDANGNRQLDPRKADAVVSYEGSTRTDATGRLILRLTYPRNVGSWVEYKLTVAANGVAGTEGRSSFSSTLNVPITDVQAEATPAFRVSPYGTTDGSPRVTVTTPDGRASASLCSR